MFPNNRDRGSNGKRETMKENQIRKETIIIATTIPVHPKYFPLCRNILHSIMGGLEGIPLPWLRRAIIITMVPATATTTTTRTTILPILLTILQLTIIIIIIMILVIVIILIIIARIVLCGSKGEPCLSSPIRRWERIWIYTNILRLGKR